jgi:ribulose-5-phosphate 4-epimerase/fuculose-1-phosphate aldolase
MPPQRDTPGGAAGAPASGADDRDERDMLHQRRRELALACRVMAHTGLVDDVLGHVSERVDDRYLLVRCRSASELGLLHTAPADIRLLDLDGVGDLTGGYAPPNELPIHTELLRRRPEVQAVVHAHPRAVVAAGLAGLTLRPIFGAFDIPAARLAEQGIPTYGRAVLIRRADLAEEMTSAMGTSPACILHGHGVVTVGATVAEAVLRALALDSLARMSLQVVAAGGTLADIPPQDRAELPDLGTEFNQAMLWRHHLQGLKAAGLDLPP